MRARRGTTLVELLTVVGLVALLAALVALPGYRAFSAARAAGGAATTLAEDLGMLESSAHNGSFQQGATLEIESIEPFAYSCYRGRPRTLDPQSTLGPLIVQRSFPGVRLSGGPLNVSTPLLFASNGSAQYASAGHIAPQHQTIAVVLTASADPTRTVTTRLDLFTGAVTLGD
ncbi:MAG: hypothetical protein M3Z37_09545 [Candidatus Eremiobacteraeota bacterium]|nr:hypothetical protein [Candidatus Eremiobacteraeota bacterium]